MCLLCDIYDVGAPAVDAIYVRMRDTRKHLSLLVNEVPFCLFTRQFAGCVIDTRCLLSAAAFKRINLALTAMNY